MNSEVTQIHTDKTGKVLSLTYKQDGKEQEIAGDLFISSMPLKDLVAGMNDVPNNIAAIAKGLPYRDFVTVGLLVDKLNLKNETNPRQHRSGLLDLCTGCRRETRTDSDFQQLVTVHG